MKRFLLVSVAVLFLTCLASCTSSLPAVNEPEVGSAPVCNIAPLETCIRTDKPFANNPANFQFAIMADRTGGMRPGVFETAVEKLNLLQPEFVLCVGDLIQGYTEDQDMLDAQWDELNGIVGKLQMPFFYLPGNHDISNSTMVQDWLKRFKHPYYHFVYNNVLFLCMNSQDPPDQKFSAEQISYMADALAANSDVRWTFVLMHAPMWQIGSQWAEMETHLAGRPYTVFAGHNHVYLKETRNGSNYYILGTTGGASGLNGPASGQFDHVVWVTMTEGEPAIAILTLDGICSDNIRKK